MKYKQSKLHFNKFILRIQHQFLRSRKRLLFFLVSDIYHNKYTPTYDISNYIVFI